MSTKGIPVTLPNGITVTCSDVDEAILFVKEMEQMQKPIPTSVPTSVAPPTKENRPPNKKTRWTKAENDLLWWLVVHERLKFKEVAKRMQTRFNIVRTPSACDTQYDRLYWKYKAGEFTPDTSKQA